MLIKSSSNDFRRSARVEKQAFNTQLSSVNKFAAWGKAGTSPFCRRLNGFSTHRPEHKSMPTPGWKDVKMIWQASFWLTYKCIFICTCTIQLITNPTSCAPTQPEILLCIWINARKTVTIVTVWVLGMDKHMHKWVCRWGEVTLSEDLIIQHFHLPVSTEEYI